MGTSKTEEDCDSTISRIEESKDIEELRAAAEDLLSVGNSSTDQISKYLADAADALESYLAYK